MCQAPLAAQDTGAAQDNRVIPDTSPGGNSMSGGSSSSDSMSGASSSSDSPSGPTRGDTTGVVGAGDRDLRIRSILEWFDTLDNALPALEVDSNEDGQADYLIKTNIETGDKMMEVLDYNHDGEMDDIYFYRKGVLVERAIDSNYDGLVDLWVYIEEGVYIAYFERDTDYDGRMDELKRYSESSVNEE
jgi:hypothetical protein